MKTVQIPGVSFPVSSICLGCALFGSKTEKSVSFDIMDRYLERGGRFFNTAHEYGFGKSEDCLGEWIKSRGCRDQILVTTKGGEDSKAPNGVAMHYGEIIEDLDESLERMGLDYVDFYLLHFDDETVSVAEILEAMEAVRKAGKTRYYGCSNWSVARQREAAAYAKTHGMQGFVVDEIEFSMARNHVPNGKIGAWMDESYIALHEEDQVGVGGYSPLAAGFLSKLVRDGDANGCRSDVFRFKNAYTYEVARRLKKVCEETGWSPSQVQLAWLLNHPYSFSSFLILGASNTVQLDDSLGAFDVELTPELIAYLHPDFSEFPD